MIVCTERKKPTFFQKSRPFNLNIARMLAFCYEDMILGNTFPKIVTYFSKSREKSQREVLKWYKQRHFSRKCWRICKRNFKKPTRNWKQVRQAMSYE